MKAWIAWMAAVCLAMPAMAWNDGAYKGTGQGKDGPVKVKVVVAGGKIASVAVTRHGDTEAMMEAAKAVLIPAMVEKNTADVDVMGGATLSSGGIKSAVADALKKAE